MQSTYNRIDDTEKTPCRRHRYSECRGRHMWRSNLGSCTFPRPESSSRILEELLKNSSRIFEEVLFKTLILRAILGRENKQLPKLLIYNHSSSLWRAVVTNFYLGAEDESWQIEGRHHLWRRWVEVASWLHAVYLSSVCPFGQWSHAQPYPAPRRTANGRADRVQGLLASTQVARPRRQPGTRHWRHSQGGHLLLRQRWCRAAAGRRGRYDTLLSYFVYRSKQTIEWLALKISKIKNKTSL